MFFDSHAHFDDEKFDLDRDELIEKCYQEGITNIITAGYNTSSSEDALNIANKYDFIFATAGISPNDIGKNKKQIDEEIRQIEKIAKNKKVLAIGEIGLDYYWNKENLDLQKYAFKKQIELANKLNKPIVIHTRDAVMDTLEILKENKAIKKGVFHCCPLNRELIKEALKLGYYISFAGPITFKNSKNADEIINLVPLERILVETDSPYLAPEPFRGTRNNSINVKYIAEKIAKVKGMSVEKIAKITCDNTKKILEIK
ncbi:MAG: TatD family hydrolase [Clostridia bacterium]|nr:TatD family hydrolase [Clostridia bacterium]